MLRKDFKISKNAQGRSFINKSLSLTRPLKSRVYLKFKIVKGAVTRQSPRWEIQNLIIKPMLYKFKYNVLVINYIKFKNGHSFYLFRDFPFLFKAIIKVGFFGASSEANETRE